MTVLNSNGVKALYLMMSLSCTYLIRFCLIVFKTRMVRVAKNLFRTVLEYSFVEFSPCLIKVIKYLKFGQCKFSGQ